MADRNMILGIAGIAEGAILYLGAVVGLWGNSATSPIDVGVTSAAAVFVLLGLGGILLSRQNAQ